MTRLETKKTLLNFQLLDYGGIVPNSVPVSYDDLAKKALRQS